MLADSDTDVATHHPELTAKATERGLTHDAVFDTTQHILKMTLCPYIFIWVMRRAQEYLPRGRSDMQIQTMNCCATLLALCGSDQKLNPRRYHCLVTSFNRHMTPEALLKACALVANDIRRYKILLNVYFFFRKKIFCGSKAIIISIRITFINRSTVELIEFVTGHLLSTMAPLCNLKL